MTARCTIGRAWLQTDEIDAKPLWVKATLARKDSQKCWFDEGWRTYSCSYFGIHLILFSFDIHSKSHQIPVSRSSWKWEISCPIQVAELAGGRLEQLGHWAGMDPNFGAPFEQSLLRLWLNFCDVQDLCILDLKLCSINILYIIIYIYYIIYCIACCMLIFSETAVDIARNWHMLIAFEERTRQWFDVRRILTAIRCTGFKRKGASGELPLFLQYTEWITHGDVVHRGTAMYCNVSKMYTVYCHQIVLPALHLSRSFPAYNDRCAPCIEVLPLPDNQAFKFIFSFEHQQREPPIAQNNKLFHSKVYWNILNPRVYIMCWHVS